MPETRKRHWSLTAWLIFIAAGSSAIILYYLLRAGGIWADVPDRPAWWIPMQVLWAIANLFGTIALFKWRKWGFWVICAAAIVPVVADLVVGKGIGSVLGSALGSFVYVGVLYQALQIGEDKKGWAQLQ